MRDPPGNTLSPDELSIRHGVGVDRRLVLAFKSKARGKVMSAGALFRADGVPLIGMLH